MHMFYKIMHWDESVDVNHLPELIKVSDIANG